MSLLFILLAADGLALIGIPVLKDFIQGCMLAILIAVVLTLYIFYAYIGAPVQCFITSNDYACTVASDPWNQEGSADAYDVRHPTAQYQTPATTQKPITHVTSPIKLVAPVSRNDNVYPDDQPYEVIESTADPNIVYHKHQDGTYTTVSKYAAPIATPLQDITPESTSHWFRYTMIIVVLVVGIVAYLGMP
jgi:hypothetical protein